MKSHTQRLIDKLLEVLEKSRDPTQIVNISRELRSLGVGSGDKQAKYRPRNKKAEVIAPVDNFLGTRV